MARNWSLIIASPSTYLTYGPWLVAITSLNLYYRVKPDKVGGRPFNVMVLAVKWPGV